MISIVSVNYNCIEWMKLLVNSVRKFTVVPHELIIVDNHSEDGSARWLEGQKDVKSILLDLNIKHGPGLDLGIKYATKDFCFVMDIDAHLQRKNWDLDLISLYYSKPKIKLIAAKGGDPENKLSSEEAGKKWETGDSRKKPIHACFQFFETAFFRDSKLSFIPRDGHDVGRKNYYDVVDLGYEVLRIPASYEDIRTKRKFYEGAWGDEYYIKGQRIIYHNWYSSRMYNKDKVDNLTREVFEKHKKVIFEHPKVKEILN